MARILFVNSEGRIGGAEVSLLLLVGQLRRQFTVWVACPAACPLSRALATMRIRSYDLPVPPPGRYASVTGLAYGLRTAWRLARIVFKTNPDVVHANSFYAAAPSILASLVAGRKLVLHARDLADFGFLSRLCGAFCRRIVAVSFAVKSALVEKGVNPEKVKVVYNGVDWDSFGPSRQSRESAGPPGAGGKRPFVFAHVGQFVPWKNHIVFLRAAEHVARGLPDARFVFVGDDISGRDGAYKRSVLSYAKNSPIAERVEFWGWRTDMGEVWPRIDCLVHTAEREPFGRVIIEAMAHCIPVIAANCSGPSEIIQDYRTGMLVPGNNVERLSEAMLHVARDSQFAHRMADAAYKHVLSTFTADKTAEQIQEVYRELLCA